VWQVPHWLATTIWVWFHLLGVQPVTLWQVPHVAVVGIWLGALPVAVDPLWQVAQLVATVNVLWSTFAPAQLAVVLWQLSQLPVTVA
jgi:hypothetical protein